MTSTSVSPLLDFDPSRPAMIEPSEQVQPRDVPAACVITFFGDVVDRLRESGRARVISANRWEDGSHPLLELEHDGRRWAVLHSGVGAPLAAGLLEETIALGCRAFVACGGAGVLRPDLTLGHLVVVESAVRDEGTSHHYLSAGRYVDADRAAVEVLQGVLTEREVPFVTGRVWTTDAPYRETRTKIIERRDEGCVAVEMEASALAAVAAFRGVPLARSSTAATICPVRPGTTGPGRAGSTSATTSSTWPPRRRCGSATGPPWPTGNLPGCRP